MNHLPDPVKIQNVSISQKVPLAPSQSLPTSPFPPRHEHTTGISAQAGEPRVSLCHHQSIS